MMEAAVNAQASNHLSIDRFEESFEKVGLRLIEFIQCVLLPKAEGRNRSEDIVHLTLSKADFMRQLIVYVPKYRNGEYLESCRQLYNHAIQLRQDCEGWSQSVLSCYANAACFASEVYRNRD